MNIHFPTEVHLRSYHIVGKFGKEKVWRIWQIILIHPTKTIQISTYNYNLLAESIHSPTFFAKCSKLVNSSNFLSTKLSSYTV